MKFLYKPFSIFARKLGGQAGRQAFTQIWAQVGSTEKPPKPTAGPMPLAQVAATAALQAGLVAASTAVADQLAARFFRHLFGAWPAKPAELAEASAAAADHEATPA